MAESYSSLAHESNSVSVYAIPLVTSCVAKPTGNIADNLEDIKSYAVKQGFDLEKDFTQVDITSWMQRLDMGDSLAAIKKEIETKAMIGQPESVKSLMRQGLTVSDVYQPFVTRVGFAALNLIFVFKKREI